MKKAIVTCNLVDVTWSKDLFRGPGTAATHPNRFEAHGRSPLRGDRPGRHLRLGAQRGRGGSAVVASIPCRIGLA